MNFDEAFNLLIQHEGGYVWDARDPGGETKWGISKRSYPTINIRELSREGARAIYQRDFWNCIDGVDGAVKFQVFDAAVNHGVGNAVRMLQRAVGVADDGHWGQMSSAAAARMIRDDVLMLFLSERLEFMCKLTKFDAFGRGWSRRIAGNLRIAAKAA